MKTKILVIGVIIALTSLASASKAFAIDFGALGRAVEAERARINSMFNDINRVAVAADARAEGFYDPDSDSDGVIDRDDWCPDEGGFVGSDGCPVEGLIDADHDGIIDSLDDCDEEAGVMLFRGCPPPIREEAIDDEDDGDVVADDADDEVVVVDDVAPPEDRALPALETPGEFHVIDAILPRPAAEDASSFSATPTGFENPADGGCSLTGSSSNSSLISILALAFSLLPLSIRRKLR